MSRSAQHLTLDGSRVLEVGTMVAVPYAASILGDMGAEVIKIEPPTGDNMRRGPGRRPWGFNEPNRNKLGVSLNLRSPRGQELFLRLVEISDVVISNISPYATRRLGLEYETLSLANPRVIYVRLTAFGATGPAAMRGGTSATVEAASGAIAVNGYCGRAPVRPGGYYADLTSSLFAVLATLAALRHRDSQHRGQHIDIAMSECTAHLLGNAIVDYLANGNVAKPHGNRDLTDRWVPNGCYACSDPHEWIALSIDTDREWRAFCETIGNPDWALEPRFSTRSARKHHEPELDSMLAQWAMNHDARDVTTELQAAGIAAGVVASPGALLQDPQLAYRGFFSYVDQPDSGVGPMKRLGFRPPSAAAWARRRPPRFAEHNDYVFGTLLDLHRSEIDALYAEGITSSIPLDGVNRPAN